MSRHEYGKLMAGCTSLKIGGPAFCWFEADDLDGLMEALSIAEARKKAVAIFGKGTNILVKDEGFDGVAVRLGKGFDYIKDQGNGTLEIGSAVSLSRLIKECKDLGLTGCEFLAGIPGSFGGALFMNAGVRDIDRPEALKEIKDIIVDAEVFDLRDKRKKTLKRRDIGFCYRSSGLEGMCILSGRIRLEKDKKSAIIDRIDSFMKKRLWLRDLGFPSAGSIFKNPDNASPAGRLIEECGLKGCRIGGAEISRTHANIIINRGGGTSKDVFSLIGLAKEKVEKKFGIGLKMEIKVI